MAKTYIMFGKNAEKEWPVVSYVDVYSAKKHYVKLEAAIKENKERIERGEEPIPTKYDPSNNIADSYFVLTTNCFMTFDSWKAYYEQDEYSREAIREAMKGL